MASCITSQWTNTGPPQMRLTVNQSSSTDTSATLSWKLEYIATSAAESNPRSYKVIINGETVKEGSYAINGKVGTYEVVTGSVSITKGTSAKTISFSVSVDWNLTWSGVYKGTVSTSGSISVAAKTSYTITYNANGGSGAPSSQTKWHGTNITLSTTKPTRTGHSFQGWATSSSGSVAYAAGASYSANANVTLYAIWKANTYTVTYNANGGTGAPPNQIKTYGQPLTLSNVKPTRANYNFLGWTTSASSSAVSYSSGASYPANANITLYAVWSLAYIKPIIYNLTASHCDSNGTESADGTCGLIKFSWECTYSVSAITISWSSVSSGTGSIPVAASGTVGSVVQVIGDDRLSTEATYTITVSVKDSNDSSDAITTLHGNMFPIDIKSGGTGVSFGKSSELGAVESLGGVGVADFGFDAKFNEPVYGNVMGLSRLPRIEKNSDLNNYMETGCWAIYSNSDAETISNMPPKKTAGRLEVSAATGEGIRLAEWSYLRQRFIPYSLGYPVWERDISRSDNNVWTYGPWVITSIHGQKVLWSGAFYMNANQSIELSDLVSNQPNGIMLVFSRYTTDAGAEDSNFNHFFVAKKMVELMPGCGSCFQMTAVNFSYICAKYLYISNDRITGNAINEQSGSNNGVTYANNAYVLRYVLGV